MLVKNINEFDLMGCLPLKKEDLRNSKNTRLRKSRCVGGIGTYLTQDKIQELLRSHTIIEEGTCENMKSIFGENMKSIFGENMKSIFGIKYPYLLLISADNSKYKIIIDFVSNNGLLRFHNKIMYDVVANSDLYRCLEMETKPIKIFLKKELEFLKKELEIQQKTMSELKNELELLKKELEIRLKTMSELKKELEFLKQELEIQQTNIVSQNREISLMQEEISFVQKKIEFLDDEIKEIEEIEIGVVQERIEFLNVEIEDIEEIEIGAPKRVFENYTLEPKKKYNHGDIEKLFILPKYITRKKKIGTGIYGTVYKGKYFNTDVAIKKLNETTSDSFETYKEIYILSRLRHPNVMLIYGYTLSLDFHEYKMDISIVTELCNTSLDTVLDNRRLYLQDDKERMVQNTYLIQIAMGMRYLESKHILHRDLKPANVLVSLSYSPIEARDFNEKISRCEFTCKIADYGLSKYFNNTNSSGTVDQTTGTYADQTAGTDADQTAGIGTPIYMAPELITDNQVILKKYPFACDVYSFGIMANEIYTKTKPYAEVRQHGISRLELARRITGVDGVDKLRPKLFEKLVSEGKKDFVQRCWDDNAADRPKWNEIQTELEQLLGWT